MRIAVTLYFVIGCILIGKTQAEEDADKRKLFEKKHYSAVWKYYNELLKKDSLDPVLNYKMGICYLNSRSQKAAAINCFKKAILKSNNKVPLQTYKLLADAFYLATDYEAASKNYERCKKDLKEDKNTGFSLEEIEAKIELCRLAKELRELKGSVAVFEMKRSQGKGKKDPLLGRPIPSSLLSIESDRSKPTEPILFDKEYFETRPNSSPVFDPESRKWDTSTVLMETTLGTSTDGQIILVYKNSSGEPDLYTTVLNGNEWKDPEELSRSVSNNNWEPNEFVSANGKELYFASDRAGGYGGMDIYKCTKLENGEWSKAINMGPVINSRFDEEAPFIHPDGTSLYFSSNRLRSNGYFDNFMTVFADSGSWRLPVNVGYPSFQSNNKDGIKKDKVTIDKDNYIVTFNDKKGSAITVMKRIVTDHNGKILPHAEITVINNETDEVSGIYQPDASTGKISCIIPSQKNNGVIYESEGFLFYSENVNASNGSDFYRIEKPVVLLPVEKGSKVVLNNIFFSGNSSTLPASSNSELDRLLKLLIAYPKMKVEISTTLEQKSNYEEIKLAGDRLRAILNFLSEKGIPKENLESRVYLKNESKKKKRKKKDEIEFGKPQLEILKMN
jgi:tetratricopeptide (TPR) repeat protein/outer membrane protein OmpA-like peptidoglycan-associated protein